MSWIATWLVTPRRTALQTLVWYVAVVFVSWVVPKFFAFGSDVNAWSVTHSDARSTFLSDRWTEPLLESVQWFVLSIVALLAIVSGWLIVRYTRECAARAQRVTLPWVTGPALGLLLANLFALVLRSLGMGVSVKVVLIIDSVLVPLVIAGAVGSLARSAYQPGSNAYAPSNSA
ncbi:MAG: hypothetical protein IBJ18_01655 [Phycisphaerales bacterium]|nr:hypothetical protein [Phycisphaerales bacterium]